ncbi:MAG: hypothetical protein MJD61_00680 [Proteobacteria bacterium]|nr:hypothetical protein [Pseudomonadota bacterium]
MTEEQVEDLLDEHWHTWAGSAHREGQGYVVCLTPLASEHELTIMVEDQSRTGYSPRSFEEAIRDIATKVAPEVPLIWD